MNKKFPKKKLLHYLDNKKGNESTKSINAFDLKGSHSEDMNDDDIYYISIQSVPVQEIPSNLFVRFVNTDNFACINTTISDLSYKSFVNASNLVNVWIYDNKITNIEQGFLKDASNSLQKLVLSSNEIRELNKQAFGSLSTLQDLYLDRNSLSIIRNNTFTGLSTLFTLSLKLNKIESFEQNAFIGLSTLVSLYLNENRITIVDSDVFKVFKQLKVLSLSYNIISHLDDKLFDKLKKLGYLELDNNRLKIISFMELLNELEFIDIANNQVDAIKKFNVDFMPKFQELYATGNLCIDNRVINIQNVNRVLSECFRNYKVPNCMYRPHGHFRYMCEVLDRFDLEDKLPTSVTYNDIHYLKIVNISQTFSFSMLTQKFSKLEKILIQNSNLTHVLEQDFNCAETRVIDVRLNNLAKSREYIFSDCKKLQHLILIKNKIPSLSIDFLRDLENTKLLDLSFNELKNKDLELFNQNFPKLEKLHLSGNRFTLIDYNLFLFMENLRILKLDFNQIVKIEEHAFASLKNLKELHLEFNGIEDTLFLKDLVKLTYLNLEENRIKKISSNFPRTLQYIDMSFNQVDSIDVSILQEMKSLNDLILIMNDCINKQFGDIKFLSKNITEELSNESCSIK